MSNKYNNVRGTNASFVVDYPDAYYTRFDHYQTVTEAHGILTNLNAKL